MPEHPRAKPPSPGSFADPGASDEARDFRFLVDNASEAIAVVSRDGTILYFNQAVCEQTGYTPEDLNHRPLAAFLHPAEASRVLGIRAARHAGEAAPPRYESLFLLPNGQGMPVEVSVAAITWMGQPVDAVFFRDLTAQRRADQALRESEERWRQDK